MTCRELAELVTDRLEGRLRLLPRLRFELHLALCRACRASLRQLRATLRALAALRAAPPPSPEALDALRRRFQTWVGRGRR